jgi:hypothetical protein
MTSCAPSNEELGERSVELDHARNFLDSLVNSIGRGMVVVYREMRVMVWNRGCEELWGLRPDEATGAVFTGLDTGLPMAEVRRLIGNAFVDPDNTAETVVDAVNRRGRPSKSGCPVPAFDQRRARSTARCCRWKFSPTRRGVQPPAEDKAGSALIGARRVPVMRWFVAPWSHHRCG